MPSLSHKYIDANDFIAKKKLGILFEGYVIGWGRAYVRKAVIMPGNQNGYNPNVNEVIDGNLCRSLDVQEIDNSLEEIKQSWERIAINGRVTYTLNAGENLTEIAQLYNLKKDELLRLNNMKSKQEAVVGQQIILYNNSPEQNTTLKTIGDMVNTVSLTSFGITNSPQSIQALDLYKNGRFAYVYNGSQQTAKFGFNGNKSVSAKLIADSKVQFNTKIKYLNYSGKIGVAASWAGLALNVNEISKGMAEPVVYVDLTVGGVGVVTDLATYFSGIEVPIVGQAVAYYGVCRLTWDAFFSLGSQYGPVHLITEWFDENTGFKGRQKKQQKVLENINETLLERLNRK